MKVYVTFGQSHSHEINGKIFDKDVVAEISGESYPECREKAFRIFGSKFSMCYPEKEWDHEKMSYFPGGIIKIA